MNRALKAATGDVIVRVDGHTVIAPNYVRTCVNALNSSGADNVGGALNPIGIGRMGQVIAAASKSPFAIPTAFRTSQQAQSTDTVYMGAYRRSVFDAVGCFDEAFAVNEDYEFNYRLREAGGHVFFCPQICSEYYGRQSLMALAHQHFRYGFWKPRTVLKHPKSLRLRQLAAPLMVAFLIVGGLLNRFNPAFTPLWLSGIALYLAANLSFSASIAGDKGRWMLPLLPSFS